MKILYWAPSLGITLSQSGGAGTHMRGVIQGLRNAGCKVLPIIGGDIWRLTNSSNPLQDIGHFRGGRFRGIIKAVLPLSIRYLICDLRILNQGKNVMKKARNTILNFSPDIVYERQSTYLIDNGLKIAKRLRIPYVLESDVNLVEFIKEEFGTALSCWGNRIELRKHKYADVIFVMAKAAKEDLVRKYNISPDKIFVKGLGVDADLFNLKETKKQSIRKNLNLHDKIVIGFIGVFRKYHKVDLLLRAAKILQENHKNIVFLIIGYGEKLDEYRRFVKENSINNVIFTGKVPYMEIPVYLSALDIGVIPGCATFMYPVKVLEYGAMKKPVIVPRYRAFDNLIEDGYNGLFFEPNSAPSFAKAVVRLADSPDKRKIYGERFYKEVVENYTWDKIGEKTLKIIESILNDNRRGI